ncbi:MAG: hypothetical protein V7L23_34725 [Nostoc sp.]|uniref:hypothetical protein n=1 Tax=Nostoc sp. TaxID=1180 RepID=UPI002FF0BE2B
MTQTLQTCTSQKYQIMRGGILRVVRGEEIYVDFGDLVWMKSHYETERITDYWHSQGFAEAELLQYIFFDGGCLEVVRDLPESGFYKGTGTLEEEVYNLPF